MKARLAQAVILLLSLVSIAMQLSCNKSRARKQQAGRAPAERVEKNPDRNAYFGEEHIHTSWSLDAWVMGNRITSPDDALKYAQGQTIKHPLGYDIKIETPMDFMGVTDHSEYVGVTKQANTPGVLREQASRSAAFDYEGSERSGGAAAGVSLPALTHQQTADQGVHEPASGGPGLEGK